jgi:glycosyltransferase involved in cell wall biosynthesis
VSTDQGRILKDEILKRCKAEKLTGPLTLDIAHFIPYTGTIMGGPVQGVAAYVGLLADAGYPVTVYSVAKGNDGESVRLDSRVRHVQARAGWGGFRRSPALWREAQAADMGFVHSHGLWTDVHRLAAHVASTHGLPHLLAPCGMLSPGALRRHWWKKTPVRLWFQDRALREAKCLHAKSNQEYEHIRRFGLRNPVAIIANPILLPPQTDGTSKAEFRRALQIPEAGRTLLFLGRLHPVKGLPRLLRAWARIQTEKAESRKQKAAQDEKAGSRKQELAQETEGGGRRTDKWVLVLAGPDEGGHRRELESLVAGLGCQSSVMFAGELNDEQKWGALAAADLFVMPSDFENFGNAVVEAMLSGLPVVTTTGTPWQELPAGGAGWWVEPTVDALAAALREALAMSDGQRGAMGLRGLQLAERFRPGRVSGDLIAVYQWLLGRGPKPGCVV